MGILTYHFEWNTNSIYLLLSLPVKGRTVIAAKASALLTGVVGLIVISVGSYVLLTCPPGGKYFSIPELGRSFQNYSGRGD